MGTIRKQRGTGRRAGLVEKEGDFSTRPRSSPSPVLLSNPPHWPRAWNRLLLHRKHTGTGTATWLKVETEHQELISWTAVSTLFSGSRQHGAESNADGDDFRWNSNPIFHRLANVTGKTSDKGQQEKSRISCRCYDKETVNKQKLSRRKIMAKPCHSQTKWSVPLKIALMNWLLETWLTSRFKNVIMNWLFEYWTRSFDPRIRLTGSVFEKSIQCCD